MKRLSTLFFVLFVVICNAQTYRYIYEHKRGATKIENIVLDINPEDVRLYEYGFIEADSLTKVNNYAENKFQRASASGQTILRKRNSFENITLISNGTDAFSIKTTDEMKWKLHNETKDYQGNTLYKATTSFGGRNWIAWYSPDIPLQEGPYKFRGLPGLIFEIYDEENKFSFHLKQNTNLKETYTNSDKWILSHYGKKHLSITKKQWQKMKKDADENPFRHLYEALKNGSSIMINNQQITTTEQLDKLSKEERDKRRKANKNLNTIEID